MGALARATALFALLLAGACAQRTYVVYPPGEATFEEANSCVLDFTGIIVGKSTVADLASWKRTAQERPNCEGLKLVFHAPGTGPSDDPVENPEPSRIVGQIVLDSAPERLALKYPPVIHAILAGEVTVVGPTQCPVPPVCRRPPPRPPRQCPVVPPAPRQPSPDPPPDPLPDITPQPLQCEPSSSPEEDVGDDARRRRRPQSGGTGVSTALPAALVGGGIIYALAVLKMLPFAGGMAIPQTRRNRPPWQVEPPDEPGPLPLAGEQASPIARDPRVRLKRRWFEGEGA